MTKQIALVTGGSGGIGEAINVSLRDAGYTVVVTYSPRNAGIDTWLVHMEVDGRKFHGCFVDVAEYESCASCVTKIVAKVGQTFWSTMPASRATPFSGSWTK